MSAATLSPTEQDEVTRFGIHDDEAFTEIVGRFDDKVQCCASRCEEEASVVLVFRCCGESGPICDGHLERHRREIPQLPVVTCAYCRRRHVAPTFDGIFDVVQL